jgi:DNA polymerase III delta prime subunit
VVTVTSPGSESFIEKERVGMFDNIIGQDSTILTLKKEIEAGMLPRALLFYGPLYAGKLSCALETARIVTCEHGNGEWSCDCLACMRQRLLIHPNLLLLSYRNFNEEIAASAEVFLKTRKRSAQFLFIRAVRKLLKRFDTILWEGEDIKIKKYGSHIEQIEEVLDGLGVNSDFGGRKKNGEDLKKKIDAVVELCMKLSSFSKTENVPVNQIRRAIYWAHISASDSKKVIIIENADKMLDASSNSLLKVLEEPPGDLILILLTTRKGALIKTILSRLRPYHFSQRNREVEMTILKKIFHDLSGEYKSLREYFLAWKNLNPVFLQSIARRFIEFVLSDDRNERDICEEMKELFTHGSAKTAFLSFGEELFLTFQQILKKTCFTEVGCEQIEAWAALLRSRIHDVEVLNISPKNILETLYYEMRAAV